VLERVRGEEVRGVPAASDDERRLDRQRREAMRLTDVVDRDDVALFA
jgi:hypothetical protein